jgi:hypothetical protein
MQLCVQNGHLWISQTPPVSLYTGSMSYTALRSTPQSVVSGHYTLDPVSLSVGSTRLVLPVDALSSSESIVDSGTARWVLPSAVYDALLAQLLSEPAFQQFFRSNTTDNFFQHPSATCESAYDSFNDGALVSGARLQRELPTVSVTFADGTSLTLDGVGSYLLPCSPSYVTWATGIERGNSFVGGWTFINVRRSNTLMHTCRRAAGTHAPFWRCFWREMKCWQQPPTCMSDIAWNALCFPHRCVCMSSRFLCCSNSWSASMWATRVWDSRPAAATIQLRPAAHRDCRRCTHRPPVRN